MFLHSCWKASRFKAFLLKVFQITDAFYVIWSLSEASAKMLCAVFVPMSVASSFNFIRCKGALALVAFCPTFHIFELAFVLAGARLESSGAVTGLRNFGFILPTAGMSGILNGAPQNV